MQVGVFHSGIPALNCTDEHSWTQQRAASASPAITVRGMRNSDLITPSSLPKHVDYGFVFFQFEGESDASAASSIMETAARASVNQA